MIDFIINKLIDEKEIIEELLKLDNAVLKRNLTYEELVKSICNAKIETIDLDLNNKYNVITDGEPDNVFSVLVTLPKNIAYININRKFLGINTWLIEQVKQFYNHEIAISLDTSLDYQKYDISNLTIILKGYKEFVLGMSELLNNKNIIVLE